MTSTRLADALLWTSVAVAVCGIVGSLQSEGFPGNGDSWTLGAVAIGYCLLGWPRRQPSADAADRLAAARRRGGPGVVVAGVVVGAAGSCRRSRLAAVDRPGGMAGGVAGPAAVGPRAGRPPRAVPGRNAPGPPGWRRFLVRRRRRRRRHSWSPPAIVALPVAVDDPLQLVDLPDIPRGSTAELAIGLRATARWVGFGATIVALGGVVIAWRRANGIERRQYSIVLIGVSVVIVCSVIGALVPAVSGQRVDGPEALDAVALLALASAIAIAVVRYRLYNLRRGHQSHGARRPRRRAARGGVPRRPRRAGQVARRIDRPLRPGRRAPPAQWSSPPPPSCRGRHDHDPPVVRTSGRPDDRGGPLQRAGAASTATPTPSSSDSRPPSATSCGWGRWRSPSSAPSRWSPGRPTVRRGRCRSTTRGADVGERRRHRHGPVSASPSPTGARSSNSATTSP